MRCIGIDVGTNSARAAAVEHGRLSAVFQQGYSIAYPGPGAAEQDPQAWYRAALGAARRAAQAGGGSAQGLCFSTQGGCLVPVDALGAPLMPAISWLDTRARAQAQALLQARSAEEWLRVTGAVPGAYSFLSHLLWLRQERPDVFSRAALFLTTLDYLNLRLTGRAVLDRTNAQMTGMLDLRTGQWDAFSLELAGIGPEKLPQILPSGCEVGRLTARAAADAGMAEDTRVFNGVHDQYACALGGGATKPGEAVLSCGTAWVLLAATKSLLQEESGALACGFHALPGLYGAFYAVSAGCQTLNWTLAQTGLSGVPLEEVNRECAGRAEKNAGLLFYPYLAGDVPLNGQPCRATLCGMRLDMDAYDIALAAMEAVAFEMARALPLFARHGAAPERLVMVGGAAQSGLWADIVANVTGLPVVRPDVREAALLGAAALGACAGEGWRPIELAPGLPAMAPDAVRGAFYREKLARYLQGLPHAAALSQAAGG